jgi:hypothetical protein
LVSRWSFSCPRPENIFNEIPRFSHQLPQRRTLGLCFLGVEPPIIAVVLASGAAGASATAVHTASGATSDSWGPAGLPGPGLGATAPSPAQGRRLGPPLHGVVVHFSSASPSEPRGLFTIPTTP